MMKKSKTLARGACLLCGAYLCAHTAQTALYLLGIKDTAPEATTVVSVAASTSDTGTTYDIAVYDPMMETWRRVDMPRILDVVIKATKPSV